MPIYLPLGSGEAPELSLDLANLVVENAADSIFVMDTEGRTVFANPAVERTFGWPLAVMQGKVLHDMLHHRYPDGRPFPMSEFPLVTSSCAIGRWTSTRTCFSTGTAAWSMSPAPTRRCCRATR